MISMKKNELDTYMCREVLVSEGDEARSLSQKELGQGQEDHGWFSHGSTCTTSVFLKDTEDVDSLTKLFEGKNINQNMTLRNQLKNVKIQNAKTIQSYFTRVSQIKEQLVAIEEEVENAEVVIATLKASQDHGIHSCEECVLEGSDYFQQTLGRRRSSTHKKRREYGSNWRSRFRDSKKIPQVMRNMKNSIIEEPLIHIEHLDKKWWMKKMMKLKAQGVYPWNKKR